MELVRSIYSLIACFKYIVLGLHTASFAWSFTFWGAICNKYLSGWCTTMNFVLNKNEGLYAENIFMRCLFWTWKFKRNCTRFASSRTTFRDRWTSPRSRGHTTVSVVACSRKSDFVPVARSVTRPWHSAYVMG